jgi:hypothetical protein
MATKIQINDDETVEITSILKDTVEGWVNKHEYNNLFAVTVQSGAVKETFDYHISIADTDNGKRALTDVDHISAFYSFVGDGIAGLMDFEEFMDEFGYEDCRKGYRIHKACEAAQKQCARLGLGDLYAVSDYIQEKYPDAV